MESEDLQFQHHSKRRKKNHDYKAPWKYHITINKAKVCPAFSQLKIRQLTPEGVDIENLPIGKIIAREIWGINRKSERKIKILQYKIMPDHIHILLQVFEQLPMHLGYYIGIFKAAILKECRSLNLNSANGDSGVKEWKSGNESQAKDMAVFEDGYNDRIILPEHNLNDVYQYIRHNPYRLAVRLHRPDFFSKSRNVEIGGRKIELYGNHFLYRNPFKIWVVVHRKDSNAVFDQKMEDCLYVALNGGVVVSPFIAERERLIRDQIEAVGGKMILINNRPFEGKSKPERSNFNLCSEGRLLIISAMDYLNLPKTGHLSRAQCLDMNKIAEQIAGSAFQAGISFHN